MHEELSEGFNSGEYPVCREYKNHRHGRLPHLRKEIPDGRHRRPLSIIEHSDQIPVKIPEQILQSVQMPVQFVKAPCQKRFARLIAHLNQLVKF
jgi:hypothetical protein